MYSADWQSNAIRREKKYNKRKKVKPMPESRLVRTVAADKVVARGTTVGDDTSEVAVAVDDDTVSAGGAWGDTHVSIGP